MEKEAADMLSNARMMQEAERTRIAQGNTSQPLKLLLRHCDLFSSVSQYLLSSADMKPLKSFPGNGFSYYSEQHGSHFHSWSSMTVWSSTSDIAPTVQHQSGPGAVMIVTMALVGLYLAIGAAFWATYGTTRCADQIRVLCYFLGWLVSARHLVLRTNRAVTCTWNTLWLVLCP
jgi:hypothetical protein